MPSGERPGAGVAREPFLDRAPARVPAGASERAPGYARPVLQAGGIVAVTAGVAALARALLHVQDVEMLFLLGVMITALVAGRRAALVSAALSVATFDFFFVPPYYTFDVADPRYIVTFGTMFAVSLVIGTLTLRLREQREAAEAREQRTAALHAASRELSGASDGPGVAIACCRGAAAALAGEAAYLKVLPDGDLVALAVVPTGSEVGRGAADLAEWVAAHARPAGLGTATMGSDPFLCVPVRSFGTVLGVLAFEPRGGYPPSAEQRALLEALAQSTALALDRVRHAEEARRAAVDADREALRSQLLSSVSHDLRTPLAAITGAATALRADPGLDEDTRRALTDSIVEEAERLERLVGNLLDMTRLDQGAVVPKREWVPADEVVGSALTRLEKALAGRAVRTAIDARLPMLSADPVLLEQLLVNLLENAVKYTPEGSDLDVSARRQGDALLLEVADRGPGLPPGAEERVFDRFHRSARPGVRGVGLGLSIARAIARVHGGTLTAMNRPGGGAVFRLTLPVLTSPPAGPDASSLSPDQGAGGER